MMRALGFIFTGLLALPVTACIGGQTGSESKQSDTLGKTEPCDPLGAQPEPIALGEIVGVGRAADDTLYVADRDEDGSGMRAFVSQGDTLVRQRVSGTGSSNVGGRDLYQLLVEGPPAFRLVLEVRPEQTRMARAEDLSARVMEFDELGEEAELLEVLAPDVLDGLALRNLPGDVEVEYFARDESGKLLVVLRPADDFQPENARLFYGSAAALIEREVTSFERQRDGGTTHILFELDGSEADAFFPIQSSGREFMPGPATLTVDGETTDLERLDATGADAALLNGAQLRCFVGK